MRDMTAMNLRSAFGGESMAHMRYKVWSNRARKEGFPNVARLFTAIAHAERVHASNHFQALRGVDGAFAVDSMAGFGDTNTSANLARAIEGETFEIDEMYPTYLQAAESQGEKAAVRSMTYAVEAEKIHAKMYTDAKRSVDAGKDVELGPVQICEVCGHTVRGDAPDVCPICRAKRAKFRAFA